MTHKKIIIRSDKVPELADVFIGVVFCYSKQAL